MLNINRFAIKTAFALTLFSALPAQAANMCNQVWNGTVERLRVQDQANGDTVMRLYLHPGNNSDYAGYTKTDFMADVLMKAKDGDVELTGYTDDKCVIKWVDLK